MYSAYTSWRNVGFDKSNATPMCVGRWLFSRSYNPIVNPSAADVFIPFEFTRGLLLIA